MSALEERAIAAELSVIGGMMMESGAAMSAVEQLSETNFLDVGCRRIFGAAVKLASEGKPIDAVTVLSQLGQAARPFVLKAAAEVPSMSNYQHYIDIVLVESRRRKLLDTITETQLHLADGGDVGEAEQALSSVINANDKSGAGVSTAEQAMRETIEELEEIRKTGKVKGVTTGFADIDRKIGTFIPQGYYILGARSGMGKTALLLCMVRAAAKSDKRALVFSLEMPKEGQGSLAERLLAQETQIQHDTIRFSKYTDDDLQLMQQQARQTYMNNIIIDDRAEVTVLQMRATIRKVKPDVVFVDYLGLIKGRKAEKRNIEVDNISHDLKATAKICNIPVVALAQLNRETEGRKGGKPTLGDIRESDAICHDADAVMLLYREAQYNAKADADKAELIVAKNRHGRAGIVPLSWTGETMTFRSVFSDGTRPANQPAKPKLQKQCEDVEEL